MARIDLDATVNDHYRLRVEYAKRSLPRNFRKIIYSNYPEFNSDKGRVILNNVLSGKRNHYELTEILEAIARGELKMKGTIELNINSAA